MIDFGFDKLALIGAVALIVIGPEKLPRVARTVGHFIGKAQRYVSDVKAEVNRSIELEELNKVKQQFESAARELRIDLSRWSPIQLGHDLWLTRNGHGVGFWDRPEIYGEQSSRLFTAFAHAMGEHDACFVDDNGAANDDTM